MRQIKKSEQSELCSDWRRWRDLNPRAGFLRRPPGFQDRSLQPLGYISKCIPAPTFLGKKERNLERNPDFFLISYRRDPLKTQGKLKNGFQNTLPFSRPPVMSALVIPHGAPNGCMLEKITTNPPYCQSKNAAVQRFSAERGCIKGIL